MIASFLPVDLDWFPSEFVPESLKNRRHGKQIFYIYKYLMNFFSKTPRAVFKNTAGTLNQQPKTRYAKKNPITILQLKCKDRRSQLYLQFLGYL